MEPQISSFLRTGEVFCSLRSLPLAISGTTARASKIDSSETAIMLPESIKWSSWSALPPRSGEMARLYGDLDKPGPYLVLMKWHPGYMSAPHTYATDRLSLVLSGTPHYDGVKRDAKEPAVIGLFGLGPVLFELVDTSKPSWRQV
jgi:hypothetical protein